MTRVKNGMASGPPGKGGFDLGGKIGMCHSLLPGPAPEESNGTGKSHGHKRGGMSNRHVRGGLGVGSAAVCDVGSREGS